MTLAGDPGPNAVASTPLNQQAAVKLDANGNGTVSLGPQGRNVWRLLVAAVSTTTTKTSKCLIYMGLSALPGNLIDGTTTGQLDSTDLVERYPLVAGEKIFAQWTGGNPGDFATLSIFGSEQTQPS